MQELYNIRKKNVCRISKLDQMNEIKCISISKFNSKTFVSMRNSSVCGNTKIPFCACFATFVNVCLQKIYIRHYAEKNLEAKSLKTTFATLGRSNISRTPQFSGSGLLPIDSSPKIPKINEKMNLPKFDIRHYAKTGTILSE